MTLRELHSRLGQMIEQNEAEGRDLWNDCRVLFSVKRNGRKKDYFYPVRNVSNCLCSAFFGGDRKNKWYYLEMIGTEDDQLQAQ